MTTIFLAYSHSDEDVRNELEKQLAVLKRSGEIATWHDRRIPPGDDWKGTIDRNLETADIVLLLVSADFLASDYCYDVEAKRALERHDRKEARVIPVILRDCDWKNSPLGRLQALPEDGRPVAKFPDRDEALLAVVVGIRKVLPTDVGSTTRPPADDGKRMSKARMQDSPRSSNLRVRRRFSDQEQDTFLEESF
ncbi:MAG: toll/interleukin-1 receptor domain-containing protein, partial [Candidatus Eisenbacteria bacterium]